MYKRCLLKYFGAFTVFIDHAMIDFQKHRLINRGNTRCVVVKGLGECSSWQRRGTFDLNGACWHVIVEGFIYKVLVVTVWYAYYGILRLFGNSKRM